MGSHGAPNGASRANACEAKRQSAREHSPPPAWGARHGPPWGSMGAPNRRVARAQALAHRAAQSQQLHSHAGTHLVGPPVGPLVGPLTPLPSGFEGASFGLCGASVGAWLAPGHSLIALLIHSSPFACGDPPRGTPPRGTPSWDHSRRLRAASKALPSGCAAPPSARSSRPSTRSSRCSVTAAPFAGGDPPCGTPVWEPLVGPLTPPPSGFEGASFGLCGASVGA